ncbi:MAG: insulinase family protein [Candidatus Saccharimonas sp.]|nr:insulinase family protein [Planctomycetaceae bacterium]
MIARGLCVAGLVMGLSLAGVSAQEAAAPKKVGSVEGFTEYQLANGLKVVLFPEPSQPKVTVNMTILVGSKHEGYGETGMAHLLEHMLFKPTEKHPHSDRDLQERGADYNGSTWTDRTNYYETLPASDDNLEYAIGLEADRLVNCPIKAEDLSSEMTVVRNEFEMGENNAKMILEQRMLATAFEWHNYGKSTIGNRADIERVPVDNLRVFYKRYYRPDNVVLFIGGRFEEAKALALVQKYFSPLARPTEPVRSTYTDEPAQDGERHVTLRRVGKVPVASVMYHIPAASDPDFAAVAVLEGVLSGDKSGRLYKALVERRRAAKIEGTAYAWHDPSVMAFAAEVAPGNEPAAVLEGMIDTIDELAKDGATDVEVARIKKTLLKLWDQTSTNTPKLTAEMSEWAGAGDWRLFFLHRDRLQQVTTADVNRVARKFLQTSNRTVGLYVPTTEPQRTPIDAPPEVASLVKDYKGRAEFSIGEAFDASPAAIEKRVKRTAIEGIQTAFLTKKNRGGNVVVTLRLRYGKADTLFGLGQACDFLPELMTRGTKQLNAAEIQDRLDELNTSWRASGTAGSVEFTIQTKRENLKDVIDLLRQVLREPSLPTAEFSILQQQRTSTLEEQATEPQAIAPRIVNQRLNPYPPGDVRHFPSMADELKLIEKLTAADVKRVYDEFLSAQAGELVVIGDFDEASAKQALTTALGGWKTKQPYERIRRSSEGAAKGDTIKVQTPDKANAMYFAGLVLPLSDADADYPALVVANETFGGSGFASRLMGRIREKEGLSYGVGSVFRAASLDPRATLSMYGIAAPQNIEKVVTLAREELVKLLKDGITDEELAESQQGWLQGEQQKRGDDAQLAAVLANALYAGRTLDFSAKLETAVSKLTKDQIRAALVKHIDPTKLVNGVAGDLPK